MTEGVVFEPTEDILNGLTSISDQDMLRVVSADYSHRPFISSFRDWVLGTGPAIADPDALIRSDDFTHPDSPASRTACFAMRDRYISELGFCVPTTGFISFLTSIGPVIEIGAGRGALARLLRNCGGDIIASDISPLENTWTDVVKMHAVEAVRVHPDRTVLCSWPSLGGSWLGEAVLAMRPGQRLVVVGEGPGQATADDSFFDLIPDTIEEGDAIDPARNVWSFSRIQDTARIFERK